MKFSRFLLALAAIVLLAGPAEAVFQSGQKILSAWPTTGLLTIDNGGAVVTSLPESAGTVTLNGATPITVANTAVDAGSVVIFTLKTVGGTVSPNAPNVLTITPGTGFTVGGTASDVSTYNYVVIG